MYRPPRLWVAYDFQINRVFWQKRGLNSAYAIRKQNLLDVIEELSNLKISYWVFGKTLKGLVQHKDLLDDHDDDLGVFISDKVSVLEKLAPRLVEIGFKVVRSNENIISFERDYRYLDICLFREMKSGYLGYYDKSFSRSHFLDLNPMRWGGKTIFIPSCSEVLLEFMYKKTGKIEKFALRLFHGSLLGKVQRRLSYIPSYIRSIYQLVLKCAPQKITPLVDLVARLLGVRVKVLSLGDFLDLMIEPKDSFNWEWRARHLNLVTDNGKNRSVLSIVDHLSVAGTIKGIEEKLEETDTSKPFFSPANLDMDFWWGGNNYFWYCIRYQFRKNVVPYAKVNDYIKDNKTPSLFSSKYYESLDEMTDRDIEQFIDLNPIEVRGDAIVGGKHRAFAMIGRLIANKDYIPIKAIFLNE